MVSDNEPHKDHNTDQPAVTLIPVPVDQVDQLLLIARDLAGFVLLLDAAAIGDPTIAAVERILSEINDRLQEFKSWFHDAWNVANAGSSGEQGSQNA